jgi:crossover junction endonuclease MUS81
MSCELNLIHVNVYQDGNTREQEQMLSKKSKMVNTGASRNIFKLVWSEG